MADQGAVESELRKRILERFRRDGITMPYPTSKILLEPPVVDRLDGHKKAES